MSRRLLEKCVEWARKGSEAGNVSAIGVSKAEEPR